MKRTSKSSARGRTAQAASLPANPMAAQVGPEFHDETGMCAALGAGEELLGRPELERLVADREVLVVAAFDGSRMFPTWQVADGRILPGLGSVVAAMAGQPAWSVALWICTPHDDLGDRSPRDVLLAGESAEELARMAAETALRWS